MSRPGWPPTTARPWSDLPTAAHRLHLGPGRARAQPARRRRRPPPGRLRGGHRGLRLRQVVAGLRHRVRRGAAALLRVGGAVRPAAAAAGRRPRRRRDHRAAARRRAAAGARRPDRTLDRRHPHHAVQLAADAALPGRELPGGSRAAGLGLVLAEHPGRRLPGVPRPGPGAPGHRGLAGPGPLAEHPGAGHRRLARRLAGQEPPRDPRDDGLRRRPALARPAAGRPGLDPVHRRAAGGHRARAPRGAPDPAALPGHLPERPPLRAPDAGEHRQRDAPAPGAPVRRGGPLSPLRRDRPAARGAGRDVRRPDRLGADRPAAQRAGPGARRRGPARGRRRASSRTCSTGSRCSPSSAWAT